MYVFITNLSGASVCISNFLLNTFKNQDLTPENLFTESKKYRVLEQMAKACGEKRPSAFIKGDFSSSEPIKLGLLNSQELNFPRTL
jgi:hypothetical protein